MIAFHPYWIFYLGNVAGRLCGEMQHGDPAVKHVAAIAELRSDIQKFIAAKQHKLFPDTCVELESVVEKLDALLPKDADNALVLDILDHINPLINQIARVSDNFQREGGKIHMVALERQKALDLHILLEAIDEAFSEMAASNFSKNTMQEIVEAGRCLALERYTASAFHILRAVELEIRDYIILLTHKTPNERKWASYIGILTTKQADSKLTRNLDRIRDLDRNETMHPELFYSQTDAIRLFNLCIDTLEQLVEDMNRKRLLRPPGAGRVINETL